MRLIDSNIVIYACQPDYDWLRVEIMSRPFCVSQATRVEVLGWHQITAEDVQDLEGFFAVGTVLSLTDAVADKAVSLTPFNDRTKVECSLMPHSPALLSLGRLCVAGECSFVW